MLIYEATITTDEDGVYFAEFEQLDGCFCDGRTISDTVEAAAKTLQLTLADYIDIGTKLPVPVFVGHEENKFRIAVAVEVTEEFILTSKCYTVTKAALELGVTKSRVSQMMDKGILQAVPYGNERLVTISSVEERKRNPRSSGRPRKIGQPRSDHEITLAHTTIS